MNCILNSKENKDKCQKFTNEEMVNFMVDILPEGYNFSNKKILEYSFGCGNILKMIIEKVVEQYAAKKISKKKAKLLLEENIYGVELDTNLYTSFKHDIDEFLKKNKIKDVKLNLFNEDFLSWNIAKGFDLIIGNPPYIAYKKIDEQNRELIKNSFTTCTKGKFDYYYPFVQKSIDLLNDKGISINLTPSGIFKNVFGNDLREYMKKNIKMIFEFPGQQLFEDTLTSSTIFLIDKNFIGNKLIYKNNTTGFETIIDKKKLEDKWNFLLSNGEKECSNLLSDDINVNMTIATLYNKAFILTEEQKESYKEDVIKLSGSPRTLKKETLEYIIFPYRINENVTERFDSEEHFNSKNPHSYKHLKDFSIKLNARDSDETAKWFEFGRSQALQLINKEKLIISSIITKKVNLYKMQINQIPYSGIVITLKENSQLSLDDVKVIMESERFYKHLLGLGTSMSGNSFRIAPKDILKYKY